MLDDLYGNSSKKLIMKEEKIDHQRRKFHENHVFFSILCKWQSLTPIVIIAIFVSNYWDPTVASRWRNPFWDQLCDGTERKVSHSLLDYVRTREGDYGVECVVSWARFEGSFKCLFFFFYALVGITLKASVCNVTWDETCFCGGFRKLIASLTLLLRLAWLRMWYWLMKV